MAILSWRRSFGYGFTTSFSGWFSEAMLAPSFQCFVPSGRMADVLSACLGNGERLLRQVSISEQSIRIKETTEASLAVASIYAAAFRMGWPHMSWAAVGGGLLVSSLR